MIYVYLVITMRTKQNHMEFKEITKVKDYVVFHHTF